MMLEKRLDVVRRGLGEAGFDALALLPGTNLLYLTGAGFHSTERSLVGFFPTQGDPVMVIPTLECTKIRDTAPYPIRFLTWDDGEGPDAALAEAVGELGLEDGRLGVEALTMRFQELRSIERHAPGVRIDAADPVLFAARGHKDRSEVEQLRRAVSISEQALAETLAAIEPGMTESAIANRLKLEILAAGGEPSFALVQGGETSAKPHAEGGDRRVQPGEPLLIDWGAMYGGYSADITRTFVMAGDPDPRLAEIHQVVAAANLAGRPASGPGVPAQEVDRAARRVIDRAGYGEFFIHRTGHGLGLDVHEDPYIVEGNTAPLEVGNVFTVEPGIYIEGLGGVRIEDNVVITEDGAETLTSFGRDLLTVGAG